MEIVNLTPHELKLSKADGDVLTIPASGNVARVAQDTSEVGMIAGLRVRKSSYGAVEGLPEPVAGKIYVVSALVMNAAQRSDVFAPGTLLRDDTGNVIGADGLSTIYDSLPEVPPPTEPSSAPVAPLSQAAVKAMSDADVDAWVEAHAPKVDPTHQWWAQGKVEDAYNTFKTGPGSGNLYSVLVTDGTRYVQGEVEVLNGQKAPKVGDADVCIKITSRGYELSMDRSPLNDENKVSLAALYEKALQGLVQDRARKDFEALHRVLFARKNSDYSEHRKWDGV